MHALSCDSRPQIPTPPSSSSVATSSPEMHSTNSLMEESKFPYLLASWPGFPGSPETFCLSLQAKVSLLSHGTESSRWETHHILIPRNILGVTHPWAFVEGLASADCDASQTSITKRLNLQRPGKAVNQPIPPYLQGGLATLFLSLFTLVPDGAAKALIIIYFCRQRSF